MIWVADHNLQGESLMQLIGMLDSPFVRRVAISMHLLDIPFTHRPLSVFRDWDTLRGINPVVKVPTLVLDDGEVLVDSQLILDFLYAHSGRSLMPEQTAERVRAMQCLGIAGAALEKSVSVIYERELRPPERQHAPWLERVLTQLHEALQWMDRAARRMPEPDEGILQPAITFAVAWTFVSHRVAEAQGWHDEFLQLRELSERTEALPAFRAWPFPG